jgi:hypothetical protein
MSDLSYRLTELRSALIPISQFVAWPTFFVLSTIISQEPAYFLALLLVLAADFFESSRVSRGLLRDSIAGGATAVLALFFNDQDALVLGSLVALIALSRLVQKRL